jgi:Tfp pilus assembly protein PilV
MKIKNPRGSLLLEALLGVVILSTSITVVIQAMTQSLRAEIYSREASLSSIYLDNLLSELRVNPSKEPELTPEESEKYKVDLELQDGEHWKEANLKLSWTSGQKTQSIVASTYLPVRDVK